MNTEEKLFNSISDIFEKIIEKESAEQNNPKKDKRDNPALEDHLKRIDTRNQNTYSELIVYFSESDPSVSGQTGHQFDYRMMRI